MGQHTAIGNLCTTDLGTNPGYLARVAKRDYPPLWLEVCKAAKLPPSSSVDVVFEFFGGDDGVGRGTIQRIREGGSPRLTSLDKIAERARVPVAALVDSGTAPPAPPARFEDRRQISESDWALLQDVKVAATDEELADLRSRAARARSAVREELATYGVPDKKGRS